MTSIQVGTNSSTGTTISHGIIEQPKGDYFKEPHCPPHPMECQTHDHEFVGSTKLAEEAEDRHNHRFAGVSSQVIPSGNSHVHVVFTNTDFFENHHHEVAAVSGLPIPVGDNKHVHFIKSVTTIDDGHFHEFQFATLIENPLLNNV